MNMMDDLENYNLFEDESRIIAIHPNFLQSTYETLLAQYGKPIPDGNRWITTIGAHWDNEEKTRKRAASLVDGTITGTLLTNGKMAFRCLWEKEMAAEFDDEGIENVEELTEEEYENLLPPPAEYPLPPSPEA